MKFLHFIFLLFIAITVFFPFQVVKADTCEDLKKQFQTAGGKYGTDVVSQLPIYCSEGKVYNTIINFAYWAVGIAAVIAVIYGGYVYMTAGANASQATKGKNILIYSLIGTALVMLAVLIVNLVVYYLVDNRLF